MHLHPKKAGIGEFVLQPIERGTRLDSTNVHKMLLRPSVFLTIRTCSMCRSGGEYVGTVPVESDILGGLTKARATTRLGLGRK